MQLFFKALSWYMSINIYKRALFTSTLASIILLYFCDNQVNIIQDYIYYLLGMPVVISFEYDFWGQRAILSLIVVFFIRKVSSLFRYFLKNRVEVVSVDKVAMFKDNYLNLMCAKNTYYKCVSVLTLYMVPIKLVSLPFLFTYTQFNYIFNIFMFILAILFIKNYLSITNKEVSDLYNITFNKKKSAKSLRDNNSHIIDLLREVLFKK
jgi:hypothetical protein